MSNDISTTDSTVNEPESKMDTGTADAETHPNNMVDERYELLSLIFRLAGRDEHGDADTAYQQNLASEFSRYKEHDAVAYVAQLPLGYDAVFKFAVHIVKADEDFQFISDITSLVEDGRWTMESVAEFLALLNSFYAETGFSAFYQSNLEVYEAETKRFIENTYSRAT